MWIRELFRRPELWCGAVGALLSAAGMPLIAVGQPQSRTFTIGGALTLVGAMAFLVATLPANRDRPAATLEQTLRRRVAEITDKLDVSAQNLGKATDLIDELQQEMVARHRAIEELNAKVIEGEKLAQISAEATEALNKVFERAERRIGRLAWWQGACYALFGAAVAILATGYAEPIGNLFK